MLVKVVDVLQNWHVNLGPSLNDQIKPLPLLPEVEDDLASGARLELDVLCDFHQLLVLADVVLFEKREFPQ